MKITLNTIVVSAEPTLLEQQEKHYKEVVFDVEEEYGKDNGSDSEDESSSEGTPFIDS